MLYTTFSNSLFLQRTKSSPTRFRFCSGEQQVPLGTAPFNSPSQVACLPFLSLQIQRNLNTSDLSESNTYSTISTRTSTSLSPKLCVTWALTSSYTHLMQQGLPIQATRYCELQQTTPLLLRRSYGITNASRCQLPRAELTLSFNLLALHIPFLFPRDLRTMLELGRL